MGVGRLGNPQEDVAKVHEQAFSIDRILEELKKSTRHDVVAFTRRFRVFGKAEVGALRVN